MATLKEIELKAKHFADARARLAEDVRDLQDIVEKAKRTALPTIKERVRAVKDHEAALRALVGDSAELFVKPRTVTVHGVKVGFAKGKGKVTFEDADQVLKLIKKHFFDEQAAMLIATTEKPNKEAILLLAARDVKMIACAVVGTGDQVVVKDTASDVDKLVTALLEESAEEEVEA